MGCQDEVVFNMHTNGLFEFGPLRYVQGSVSKLYAFVLERHIFTTGLNHMLARIREEKWALYCSFVCLANH